MEGFQDHDLAIKTFQTSMTNMSSNFILQMSQTFKQLLEEKKKVERAQETLKAEFAKLEVWSDDHRFDVIFTVSQREKADFERLKEAFLSSFESPTQAPKGSPTHTELICFDDTRGSAHASSFGPSFWGYQISFGGSCVLAYVVLASNTTKVVLIVDGVLIPTRSELMQSSAECKITLSEALRLEKGVHTVMLHGDDGMLLYHDHAAANCLAATFKDGSKLQPGYCIKMRLGIN